MWWNQQECRKHLNTYARGTICTLELLGQTILFKLLNANKKISCLYKNVPTYSGVTSFAFQQGYWLYILMAHRQILFKTFIC